MLNNGSVVAHQSFCWPQNDKEALARVDLEATQLFVHQETKLWAAQYMEQFGHEPSMEEKLAQQMWISEQVEHQGLLTMQTRQNKAMADLASSHQAVMQGETTAMVSNFTGQNKLMSEHLKQTGSRRSLLTWRD